MKFNTGILPSYLSLAPIPLAFERYLEARIYEDCTFERPILDVGCGDGLFAKVVFAERIDTGVDPDPRELRRAERLDSYEELIECKGDAINKQDRSYRTIFSNSVLEHISDIDPVLVEIHRLLDHGGRFYATVPTDKFDNYSIAFRVLSSLRLYPLAKKYGVFFNHFWMHHHYYTPDEWIQRIERSGLKVVRWQTYGSVGSCLLNDFLAPFSVFGFVCKKLMNQWTLFPVVRRFFMLPVSRWGVAFLSDKHKVPDGGLLFLEFEKP